MSYSVVLGDMGPPMPVTLTEDGAAFVLDAVNDTITLRYTDPLGLVHAVSLTIVNAATGACQRTWQAGDLSAVGTYFGQVKIARTGDATFPRTFPNDGSKVIWPVFETI